MHDDVETLVQPETWAVLSDPHVPDVLLALWAADEPVTVAELTERTGLGPAVLAASLRRLSAGDLLVEHGEGAARQVELGTLGLSRVTAHLTALVGT